MQCMNSNSNGSGVSSASSQTYPPQNSNAANMGTMNSMSPHVPNSVPSLHPNTHRSSEMAAPLQSNTGTMTNVNAMQDFSLDFLDQSFTSNDLFLDFWNLGVLSVCERRFLYFFIHTKVFRSNADWWNQSEWWWSYV